jgi:calcium binding protein 39
MAEAETSTKQLSCPRILTPNQIFAANPNKSYEVQKFLIMNKQRLLKFLPNFLADRTDDDQFNDEKAWLVKAIGNLPDSTAALVQPGSGAPVQSQQTQVRS